MSRHSQKGFSKLHVVLSIVIALLVGVAGFGVYTYVNIKQIPTFAPPLAAPTSTTPLPEPEVATDVENFLVFSTGSSNLTEEEALNLGVGADRAEDADGLSDVIMVVSVNPTTSKTAILSIPRDTWVKSKKTKINSLYNKSGVYGLKDEVESITGVPIHHMVSVNFTAFSELTEAVGGVNVYVPTPLRDKRASLLVEKTGCVAFDGPTALAYVRSRHLEVYKDGQWETDASASDFGRIQRQQTYLSAVVDKVVSPTLPVRIPSLLGVAKDGLVLDESLSVNDMQKLARALANGSNLETYTYPSSVGRVGKASVVFLEKEEAAPLLTYFQNGLAGSPTGEDPAPASSASSQPTESSNGPAPSTPDVVDTTCTQ